MAYKKLISPQDILQAAVQMVEREGPDGLSLRAVAEELGVRAPSLYRYFPQKEALEVAVAEEALKAILSRLQDAATVSDPEKRFRKTVDAYLEFARERFALYSFLMQSRYPASYRLAVGKTVWNLLLEAASGVSGQPDDTAAAVAVWSFLHGYVSLEHAGAFGVSGPKGALERGVEVFLKTLRDPPGADDDLQRGKTVRRRKQP